MIRGVHTMFYSSQAEALRAFIELQHKVTGHLLHLTETGTHAYPDDVLVRILSDIAEEAGIENDLRIASEQRCGGYRGKNGETPLGK